MCGGIMTKKPRNSATAPTFNYRRSGKGAVAKLTRRVYQDMAQAVATDGVLIAEKMAEIARPGRVEWVEAVQ